MNSVIIEEDNFEKARKKIRENKGKQIMFTSHNDDLNRKIIEKEQIDILLIKQKGRKDFSKQRNSGLDSVMSKLAKKNNMNIGISFDEILNSRGKEKSEILARVKQNITLCKKNNIKMKFTIENKKYERNIRDLQALGLVLGMPTWMVKYL